MPHAPLTELPDLIEWLTNTIEPLQGQPWQITLNSSGDVVQATAKIVQTRRDNGRGTTLTITRVTEIKFRLGRSQDRKTVFSIE